MQKMKKQICCEKRRKIKWQIFGEGENQKNANGGTKAAKSNMR
jgi:hypothetical protein